MNKYFFFLLSISFILFGTDSEYIKSIDKTFKKSEKFFDNSEFEKAIELSKEVKNKSKKVNYIKGELKANIQIADCFYHMDEYKKAIKTYKNALKIATQNNLIEGMAICFKGIGKCERILGNYKQSLIYLNKGLKKYKKINDLKEIADIEFEIGGIYGEQGKVEEALRIYHISLNIFESLKIKKRFGYIIQTLFSIGEILRNEKQYKEAIKYFLRAEKISREQNKQDLLSDSLTLLGGVYEETGAFERSEKKYKEALNILEDIKDEFRLSTVYNNLGELYRKTKQFVLAKKYYFQALNLYREFEHQWGISAALANLGAVSIQLNDTKNGLKYLKEAKTIAEKQNIPILKEFIYKSMSEAHEVRGNPKTALLYYKKYIKVNNEILNKDRNAKFAEMQTKYETAKKDREIEASKAILIKTKYEAEKKDAQIKISRLKLNRQNLISRAFIGGFLIVLIFVFLLYSRYRLKKKANTELSIINTDLNNAKKIIEEKNLHITDSIKYAQRIQNAILPTKKELKKCLKDYFVIYRPKDIVSGDFYWLYQDEKRVLIAVVDCTGHGVPGALMSVMGNSLLNEIVNEKKIYKPAEVLTELNKGISKSLKKDENQSKVNDGMDVCLFYVDKDKGKIRFSGARRPLFIVKKGDKSLLELKGVRLSIGEIKRKGGKKFKSEKFYLDSGDMVYLTSDGYTDQSNPEGKKIGSRKFREMLINISDKSLNKQCAFLESHLDSHMGTEEQRDDITIIGFRIS